MDSAGSYSLITNSSPKCLDRPAEKFLTLPLSVNKFINAIGSASNLVSNSTNACLICEPTLSKISSQNSFNTSATSSTVSRRT